MNYYLDDLRQILATTNATVTPSYTGLILSSIYVDKLIEPEDLTSQSDFTLLQNTGGTNEAWALAQGEFSVFVYRKSITSAGDDSRNIFKYLTKYVGGTQADSNSVHFRRFIPRQAPMLWSGTNSPVKVFMFTMTALYNDTDMLDIR